MLLRYPKPVVSTIATRELQHEGDGKEWAKNETILLSGETAMKNSAAYANIGGETPVVVNYEGTTKIYTGPSIVFRNTLKYKSQGKFESSVFHEMTHNLGYVHKEQMPKGEHFVSIHGPILPMSEI